MEFHLKNWSTYGKIWVKYQLQPYLQGGNSWLVILLEERSEIGFALPRHSLVSWWHLVAISTYTFGNCCCLYNNPETGFACCGVHEFKLGLNPLVPATVPFFWLNKSPNCFLIGSSFLLIDIPISVVILFFSVDSRRHFGRSRHRAWWVSGSDAPTEAAVEHSARGAGTLSVLGVLCHSFDGKELEKHGKTTEYVCEKTWALKASLFE